MSPQEQIAQKMVVAANGKAICLDQNTKFNCWVMHNNHGTWVSERPALPEEIQRAKRQLEILEVFEGIPQRG